MPSLSTYRPEDEIVYQTNEFDQYADPSQVPPPTEAPPPVPPPMNSTAMQGQATAGNNYPPPPPPAGPPPDQGYQAQTAAPPPLATLPSAAPSPPVEGAVPVGSGPPPVPAATGPTIPPYAGPPPAPTEKVYPASDPATQNKYDDNTLWMLQGQKDAQRTAGTIPPRTGLTGFGNTAPPMETKTRYPNAPLNTMDSRFSFRPGPGGYGYKGLAGPAGKYVAQDLKQAPMPPVPPTQLGVIPEINWDAVGSKAGEIGANIKNNAGIGAGTIRDTAGAAKDNVITNGYNGLVTIGGAIGQAERNIGTNFVKGSVGISNAIQNRGRAPEQNPEVARFQARRGERLADVELPSFDQALRNVPGTIADNFGKGVGTIRDWATPNPNQMDKGGTKTVAENRAAGAPPWTKTMTGNTDRFGTPGYKGYGTGVNEAPRQSLQQQRTPFIPNVDRGTTDPDFATQIRDGIIDSYGRFTAETLKLSGPEGDGTVIDGKWTQAAADAGTIPQEKVGMTASWRDLQGISERKAGGSTATDQGAIAATPAAAAPAAAGGGGGGGTGGSQKAPYVNKSYGGGGNYSGGSKSSYGGRSSGGGNYGGGSHSSYGGGSRVRGGSESTGSAESEDYHTYLKDFDGNGKVDSKDIAKAKLMAKAAAGRNRRKGSMRVQGKGMSNVPKFNASAQRQKVLGNLSTAFKRPVGGWPEGL